MIQRVQSIYLVATICICIALIFVPLSMFLIGNDPVDAFFLDLMKVYRTENNEITVFERPVIPVILNICIGIAAIVTLLLYRNRRLQIKLIQFNLLLTVIFIIVLFYFFEFISTIDLPVGSTVYLYGSYLPIFQIVFCYLALRGVKHDEALVRSADRLR